MREGVLTILATCALVAPGAAPAASADVFVGADAAQGARELPPYLQCVPYARERTGVQIYGDALTWWDQAAGRYKRGFRPKAGAVMAFRPSGNMVLGHVAAVSKVIDSRTVLLDHANWSPIDGRRGQIERGVKAVDVSPANDWSEVRVWYDPLQDLGTTAWPIAGFIYNERDDGKQLGGARVLASASYAPPPFSQAAMAPNPSKKFTDAFAGFGEASPAPRPTRVAAVGAAPRRTSPARPRDPYEAVLARYDR